MKKKNLSCILLVTLITFSLTIAYFRVTPEAKATYVEGTITTDTDWTLVDSPFIVTNNIFVDPGATLTIEPGVQVLFGGNFSLTVNGKIAADGTDARPIIFSSDSVNATAGDWGTIIINSTEESSIIHCTIEFGTSAVALDNGSLVLQDNFLGFNLVGITILGGNNLSIVNNDIANNTSYGILLSGGDQVTVQNNTISSNQKGITLSGNLTGSIHINQNTILLNSQSGISLEFEEYSDLNIVQNKVMLNGEGFHVASTVSTYITHNYIFNNTNGIYYESGISHQAHFNDIYNNTVGMDVSSEASANATNNYWGSSNGPFHDFLNPSGAGNSVGGNGTDLLFIFFLSAPFDTANEPPISVLQTDKTLAAPYQNVTFIGSYSHDDGRVDQYFYDFGDGEMSGWTTLSLLNHTYSSVGTYLATLTVMDDFGTVSQNPTTTNITVQDLITLTVSMTLNNTVADSNGNVTVTVQVSAGNTPVQNAIVNLLSIKGGSFLANSGVTDSQGMFETQFMSPNVTSTRDIRLIAKASLIDFADGSCYTYLRVLSQLHAAVTTEPFRVKSEATVQMIFHVSAVQDQAASGALVTTTVDNGTLSTNMGVTGQDGNLSIDFTAPYTLSPLEVTINVTTQKSGFTNGYDQQVMTVYPNILDVSATPNDLSIPSEGNTFATVRVTCDSNPIPNATITVSSTVGNVSLESPMTDLNGLATVYLNAPQTTSAINATLTATATKDRFVNGSNQATIAITPKTLIVQLTTENYTLISEDTVAITARVTWNSAPIQNADVSIMSQNGGSFQENNATTDAAGFATFNFTAPQVNSHSTLTLVAAASNIGFVDGLASTALPINPGNLTVEVTSHSYAILPEKSVIIMVAATANSRPVANAQVIVSVDHGNLSFTAGTTDLNGTCAFTFNAPSTSQQLTVTINASATKSGYEASQNETTINVVPMPSPINEPGFPWLMLLLILVPVITAVVVLVLVKMKIMVFSIDDQEGEQ